ncbi:hypothetical protein JCGZ_19411 [Jatropha curcas]|uniref:Uncharacterized protein n=1 Tax=Jatropha curcas TaxID=180498 RepID=A0A067JZC5_JATCU|nr:hypothetical protein JCGZ_19411 [Jatropha curcas]
MASSNLSDEDFLESLGISLDDVDLTADADTRASVTGIFAQVPAGLVNQMMELILGMQQELTSSWTPRAFDDQRRTRPRH